MYATDPEASVPFRSNIFGKVMFVHGDPPTLSQKICANYFISYLVYLVSDHRYAHLAPRLVTCGLENSTSPR